MQSYKGQLQHVNDSKVLMGHDGKALMGHYCLLIAYLSTSSSPFEHRLQGTISDLFNYKRQCDLLLCERNVIVITMGRLYTIFDCNSNSTLICHNISILPIM